MVKIQEDEDEFVEEEDLDVVDEDSKPAQETNEEDEFEEETDDEEEEEIEIPAPAKVVEKRGRPRKVPISEITKQPEPKEVPTEAPQTPQYIPVPRAVSIETMFNEIYAELQEVKQFLLAMQEKR